jgi:phenylacetate-CoA ligase
MPAAGRGMAMSRSAQGTNGAVVEDVRLDAVESGHYDFSTMYSVLGWTRGTLKPVLKSVYYRLPEAICRGPEFEPTVRLLARSETWDEGRLAEYQAARLRDLLRHCARNVPYYRRLFREVGFDPERVRGAEDLRALPLLDKRTLRENFADLLAENVSARDRLYFTTGGTTGVPLGVYNMRHSGGRQRAFVNAMWARVGYRASDPRAMLRGSVVRNARHWTYDAAERAFVFSNFHMTPETVAAYARVMRDKRLRFFHSYPSAIVDFARHLRNLELEPPRFDAVFATSENLYPGQREAIEAFYGARVFSFYGHSENLVMAGECEVSSDYHVFPEYGVAEVLREDGSPAVEGETGEIVGTTIDNLAMPLVRYRTEDRATVGPPRCSCGRAYRLWRETRGRWNQEVLVGGAGNLVSLTALNMHTDVFDRVQQMQFRQHRPGAVELWIRRGPGYTDRDTRDILTALAEKVGDTMEVAVRFADAFELTPRGKFRLLVQEVDVESLLDVDAAPVG